MTRQTLNRSLQHSSTSHPLSSGILQRKCDTCGQHTIAGGTCNKCQQQNASQQGTIQRKGLHDLNGLSHSAGSQAKFSSSSTSQPLPITSLTPQTIQPKLKIGTPNDKYEQEADRIADQVMRMPEPRVQQQMGVEEGEEETLQAKPIASQITPLVQRQVESEEEEETIQTKQTSNNVPTVSPDLQGEIQNLRQSGGQPLPTDTRAFMESRFRSDFSDVRIHTNDQASRLTGILTAQAFTIDRDIFFDKGQNQFGTTTNQRLLAHELTHVLQQRKPYNPLQTSLCHTTSNNILKSASIHPKYLDVTTTVNTDILRAPLPMVQRSSVNQDDLRKILADPNVRKRLREISDIQNIKGQLFEEVFQREITRRIKTGKGLADFLPTGADIKNLKFANVSDISDLKDGEVTFIAGDRIKDLEGAKISDGMIVKKKGSKLEILTVFEAKAGRVRELSRTEAVRTKRLSKSDFTELEKYQKESESKVIRSEITGQIERDVERLLPSTSSSETRKNDVSKVILNFDNQPLEIESSRIKTKFIGVAPKDVDLSGFKQHFRAPTRRLQFESLTLDLTRAEIVKEARKLADSRGKGKSGGKKGGSGTGGKPSPSKAGKSSSQGAFPKPGHSDSKPKVSAIPEVSGGMAGISAISSFGSTLVLDIASDQFYKKFIGKLDDFPKLKADPRGAKEYLNDPRTKEAIRVVDLLNKQIPHFQRDLEELNGEMIWYIASNVAAIAFSESTTPAEKREQIDDLRIDIIIYIDDLLIIEENLEAALALEEKAMEAAKSARELSEILEEAIIMDFLIKQGFSYYELMIAWNNLHWYERKVKTTFKNIKRLKERVTNFRNEAEDAQWLAFDAELELWAEEIERVRELEKGQ